MPSSAVGPAGTPLITVSARGGCAHLCHGNTWVGEWDQHCHHQGAPADACGVVPPVAPLLTQLLVPAVGVAAPQELAWISFWILHLWKIIFSGNFPVAASANSEGSTRCSQGSDPPCASPGSLNFISQENTVALRHGSALILWC